MNPLWTAEELVHASGGTMPAPFAATGVSIDTRTLRPGELFVALAGENRDGHQFVANALARGAAGALVHADVPGVDQAKLLRVEDTLAALSRLGAYARARFAGRLVAVTGSVGKTTTKEMLRTILAAQGPTHAAEASYNNHWGVPLTLARLPAAAAFCVCEIGMNHPGEIEPLARLARPHVTLITAIERAHVGHLGSIEAIADEKAAIMRGLEPGGLAVLPGESRFLERMLGRAGAAQVVTFGANPNADTQVAGTRSGRKRKHYCRLRPRNCRALSPERARAAYGDERDGRSRRGRRARRRSGRGRGRPRRLHPYCGTGRAPQHLAPRRRRLAAR